MEVKLRWDNIKKNRLKRDDFNKIKRGTLQVEALGAMLHYEKTIAATCASPINRVVCQHLLS